MRWLTPTLVYLALTALACGPGIDPTRLDGAEEAQVDADGGAPADDGDEPDGDADGQADPDAGASDAGADRDIEPVCTVSALAVSCPHRSDWLITSYPGLQLRQVHWALPGGPTPASGHPVAIFFQGAAFPAGLVFSGVAGEAFGAYYQAATIATLLEGGFAVLAPEAHLSGTTYWDTNTPTWAAAWDASPDRALMDALLGAIQAGRFGPLDANRVVALGFSSGGYMSSRVAVAYPGRFRALAISSGAYATCAGAACLVPGMQADHPPTLFLHGALDPVVPEWTMRLYEERLRQAGVPTRIVTDALAGHQWLEAAPAATGDWFQDNP